MGEWLYEELRAPWPLTNRHLRLPKWAQNEIHELRCQQINSEMEDCIKADVREIAKTVTGGNCTFSDDDIRLLAFLAAKAVDAGLTDGISCQRTLRQINLAGEKRRRAAKAIEAGTVETERLDAKHESAAPQGVCTETP